MPRIRKAKVFSSIEIGGIRKRARTEMRAGDAAVVDCKTVGHKRQLLFLDRLRRGNKRRRAQDMWAGDLEADGAVGDAAVVSRQTVCLSLDLPTDGLILREATTRQVQELGVLCSRGALYTW